MKSTTLLSLLILLLVPIPSMAFLQQVQASTNNQCRKNNTSRLTVRSPQTTFSGVLIAAGSGYHNYRITCIDVTDFPQGGKLVIDIFLGDGVSSASFDLFPNNISIPTEGSPTGAIAGQHDISPRGKTQIIHYFDPDTILQFGATGNWGSPKGATNAYKVRMRVEKI